MKHTKSYHFPTKSIAIYKSFHFFINWCLFIAFVYGIYAKTKRFVNFKSYYDTWIPKLPYVQKGKKKQINSKKKSDIIRDASKKVALHSSPQVILWVYHYIIDKK